MLHVPIQVDYRIRALVDLAEQSENAPTRAGNIPSRQSIPEPFLTRVLLMLSKNRWSVVNETTRNILDSTSIKDLLSRVAAAKLRMAVATA